MRQEDTARKDDDTAQLVRGRQRNGDVLEQRHDPEGELSRHGGTECQQAASRLWRHELGPSQTHGRHSQARGGRRETQDAVIPLDSGRIFRQVARPGLQFPHVLHGNPLTVHGGKGVEGAPGIVARHERARDDRRKGQARRGYSTDAKFGGVSQGVLVFGHSFGSEYIVIIGRQLKDIESRPQERPVRGHGHAQVRRQAHGLHANLLAIAAPVFAQTGPHHPPPHGPLRGPHAPQDCQTLLVSRWDLAPRRQVQPRHDKGDTNDAAQHAVPVFPRVNVLKFLQGHALALLPLGKGLVAIKFALPFLCCDGRQTPHGTPVRHAQAAARQPGQTANVDHAHDQARDAAQPLAGDGVRIGRRLSPQQWKTALEEGRRRSCCCCGGCCHDDDASVRVRFRQIFLIVALLLLLMVSNYGWPPLWRIDGRADAIFYELRAS